MSTAPDPDPEAEELTRDFGEYFEIFRLIPGPTLVAYEKPRHAGSRLTSRPAIVEPNAAALRQHLTGLCDEGGYTHG